MVIGTGVEAGRDMWISTLAATFLSLPVILIYCRIASLFPGKDLIEILELNFGKLIGRLLSIPFIWFAFHLAAIVLRNFGEFISTIALPETPKTVPMIIFAFICILAVKAGIETIGRCSQYFILLIAVEIIIVNMLNIPNMEIENLRPLMTLEASKYMQSIFTAFSFPFGETVIFLMLFSSVQKKNSVYKIFLSAIIIAGLIISFTTARNIMVLGPNTMEAMYFPSYSAISRVNIGNFLQRMEIVVTIAFLLAGFIKISVALLAATKGFARLFGFEDYAIWVVPIGLLMVNMSYLLYDDITEMFEWAQKIWPYYAFPFQVILPIGIWIALEVKRMLKEKKQQVEL
jgi:spore germination protein KB